MNRVFLINAPFRVPDGTWVSPFLNARDSQSDLPFDLLDGVSLAAGMIEANSRSRIHVMPFVTQITFVRRGTVTVRMKGPSDTEPYTLRLTSEQAVLTEPGVFFQLINEGSERCEVLYIVSPAYVFEMDSEGTVLYDDAVALEQDWDGLLAAGLRTGRPMSTAKQRADAVRRLSSSKRKEAKL
jgi:mannose-6-phosphate isomerase-like protein (cupin superfamily)